MDFKDIIGGLATVLGSASEKKSTPSGSKTKSGKTIAKAGSKTAGSSTNVRGLDLGKGIEILQTLTKGVDLKDFKGLGDLSKIKGLNALKAIGAIKGLDGLKQLGNIKGFEMLKGLTNLKGLENLKGIDSIADIDLGSMLQKLNK